MKKTILLSVATGLLGCGGTERGEGTGATGPTGIPGDGSDDGATDSGDGGVTGGDDMRLDVGSGGTGGDGGDGSPVDSCEEAAMTNSNQGCEFWAVDLPNAWAGSGGSPAPEDQQYAVVVANTSADSPANVEIFLGAGTTQVASAQVEVGQIREFRLDPQSQAARQNTYDGTAYRIESDIPITAYQFNPLDNTVQVFSNDASLLFPSHVLGNDYTAVTGDGIWLTTDEEPDGDNSGAYVSVVATEDGTTVDLFPTWQLYSGATEGVQLDRGQVFTAVSSSAMDMAGTAGNGNLSGSRVVSDKPVAVFSGNVATIEPNPGECCADHLEHQMLPLVAWGTAYTAAPPPSPEGAGTNDPVAFRITGAFDGTSLTYSPAAPPGAPASIDAEQTVRFQTSEAFTVTTNDPDKPFAITEFLLSNQAIAGLFGQNGDPAMIALPATAQFQTDYVFLVPAGYAVNFVTVVRQAGSDAMLDGVSVSGGNWQSIGTVEGTEYEFIHLSVDTGQHHIECEEACGIVSVGYDRDVSYGYPGGSGLEIISTPPPPPVG